MSGAHIAVIVIGMLSLAEATLGVFAPRYLKKMIGEVAPELPPRSMGIGILFAGATAGLWFLITAERRAVDLALMLISWLFAGVALAGFYPNGFRWLMETLIVRRSPAAIRAFYACEALIAITLLHLGFG